MLKEFKEFTLKGNVVDLAVAVIIGAAFGKIVASLVNNIIMPIVGAFLGGVDFTTLSFTVGDAVIGYGLFIQAIVDFIIIAFVIFILIRFINKSKKKEEAKPPVTPNEELLLIEIRDLLKNKAE